MRALLRRAMWLAFGVLAAIAIFRVYGPEIREEARQGSNQLFALLNENVDLIALAIVVYVLYRMLRGGRGGRGGGRH